MPCLYNKIIIVYQALLDFLSPPPFFYMIDYDYQNQSKVLSSEVESTKIYYNLMVAPALSLGFDNNVNKLQ